MGDIARRFAQNPLLSPADLKPSRPGLEIACLLNPGVFRYDDKTWLVVRVAERPVQQEGRISFPVLTQDGGTEIIELPTDDPDLDTSDARVLRYRGEDFLTTLSHLRFLCSEDGIHFRESPDHPPLTGKGEQERFGIEDCRVSFIEGRYYFTFTSVSDQGVGVGLRTTTDLRHFEPQGMIFPPHNKDCALFEEKINGLYYALHRPSSVNIGGNYIWLASSPDAKNWGGHRCLVQTRKDSWDCARVGAGAAPIRTSAGWLEIYHGANYEHQYCLGAFLMDLADPSRVLARTGEPIMVPSADYECTGFFGKVVFTNGHYLHPDGDTLSVYYGASDEFVCGANFSLQHILSLLK